jgi:outer membrane lipoprotein-sorting protein
MSRRTTLLSMLCALGLGLMAPVGHADEPLHTALDTWLSGLKSLRAQFTQSITDAQGRQTDKTNGELLVLRPGRFRWDSHDERPPPAVRRPTPDRCSSRMAAMCGSTIGTCSR